MQERAVDPICQFIFTSGCMKEKRYKNNYVL